MQVEPMFLRSSPRKILKQEGFFTAFKVFRVMCLVRGISGPESFRIVEPFLQAAQEHEGELVVAAVGPLTNLALACKLDVAFPQRVKQLYVMGGAERAGNVTPASEFNFHCDPEAAHLVLKKFAHTVRLPPPWSTLTLMQP